MGQSTIEPSPLVKHLGVTLDSHLTMETNIAQVCKTAFYHLWRISKIRHFLDPLSTKCFVDCLVLSRIDYANSLFIGLPDTLLAKLQRVQNAAARLILRVKKSDNIKQHLKSLGWLPVKHRILFKTAVLTYRCLNGLAPPYLSSLISPVQNSRVLRSSSSGTLHVPRTFKVTLGDRSFAKAAPTLWNSLPQIIRNAPTILKFRSLLNIHLSADAFN